MLTYQHVYSFNKQIQSSNTYRNAKQQEKKSLHTTKRLQSVLTEKNSSDASPPLSKGRMFSFFLVYLIALSLFKWKIWAKTEFSKSLVLVPWRINVFLLFSI